MLTSVLFDLDGTLVDQESAAAAAVVEWAAEYGISGPGVAARWAELSDRHYSRYQRREVSFQDQRRARVREFLGVEVSHAEADAMFAGYARRYEAGWSVFEDAVPALREVRALGLGVVVLTNGNGDHQRFKLDRLGLAAEIDLLITGDTLPAGKPDPRAFRHATERLGVGPDEVVMVGDSLEKDVLGARAVGMEAVLVDRSGVYAGAGVPTVRSLKGLVKLLRR